MKQFWEISHTLYKSVIFFVAEKVFFFAGGAIIMCGWRY